MGTLSPDARDAPADRLRAQAAQLRAIADQLEADARRIAPWGTFIGGKEITDIAVEVLRAEGEARTYHELLPMIEGFTGRRIRGKYPKKTLVANLSRDERICPLGGGVFALAEGGE